MDQIIDHASFRFSGPVTAHSPELEPLLAHIAEGAAVRDRDRVHPYDVLDLIRRARLGALRVHAADGGGGATNRELFGVIIRLGDADSNVAHILRNHLSFVERFVRNVRTEKNRKWLDAVVQGAIFGLAFGELDLPKVGNKEANTTLTPDGESWRLNGTKYYSTGSLYADYVLVRGKLPDGTLGSAIVPTSREGVELVDDWDGFGQRVTGSGTTILRDVLVREDEIVLDAEDTAFTQSYPGAVPQLILTAINAGIVAAIQRDAVALINRRQRSYVHASAEQPADDPLLQLVVGQIASNAFAAEATVLAAADALDRLDLVRGRGEDIEAATHAASLAASKAKVVVDDLATRSAAALLDVGGASATRKLFDLDRHWRNARTLSSHNPVVYKARAIGDHAISGTKLPTSGFF